MTHQLHDKFRNDCRISSVRILFPPKHIEITQSNSLQSISSTENFRVQLIYIFCNCIGRKWFPNNFFYFGNPTESPYVDELAAYTNRFTLASREATSMFKKPETLTSLDVMGSFIDLGTEPNAA